jgi:hypothetical protein
LRDGQHAAANVLHAAIHFLLGIFENSQAANFLSDIDGIRLSICLPHANQNQQTDTDLARDLSTDGDFRSAYPLNNRTHRDSNSLRGSAPFDPGNIHPLGFKSVESHSSEVLSGASGPFLYSNSPGPLNYTFGFFGVAALENGPSYANQQQPGAGAQTNSALRAPYSNLIEASEEKHGSRRRQGKADHRGAVGSG